MLPLPTALEQVREALLDDRGLVRAVASGHRRGAEQPWRRVEIRPVELKAGRRLQVVTYDERQAFTANFAPGEDAAARVGELLEHPFGNWHVETAAETLQLRVTKKGEGQLSRARSSAPDAPRAQGNDRAPRHLLAPDDPLFSVLGASGAKRRQVDAFLQSVAATGGELPADRVRVVDLGCGNAYLTFAAHRFLSGDREVELLGVDTKAQSREHGERVAASLGISGSVRFVESTIADAPIEAADLVLALHACDTATDEALARAVRARATVLLVAPCCHHDLQSQLVGQEAPEPYAVLTRHPILRERFVDVLTDSLRAALLRLLGYRVEVVEFVAAEQTPRNVLLRAVRTGAPPAAGAVEEYLCLVDDWGVVPALQRMLHDELVPVLGRP
ncbi:methyltransferase family protein [Motilibacter peucedani]|uniref:Methyltransferase family protein n=2 Tax=Motilibacter peucedani TaxID=598650 RepID=A0A420XK73_9ACTN|nr:methyltransferase family protein [Motilibacter peucedani]